MGYRFLCRSGRLTCAFSGATIWEAGRTGRSSSQAKQLATVVIIPSSYPSFGSFGDQNLVIRRE
jgi:hypothetical protein